MARISFWSRFLGADAVTVRIFDLFRTAQEDGHFGSRLLQQVLTLTHRTLDSAPAEARAGAGPAPLDLASLTIALAYDSRGAAAATQAAQAGIAAPGPARVVEADDRPAISVLVDWPWQLAFGLVPISQNSGTEARTEPRGWVENYLDQSAQASPLHAAFDAEGFNQVAADSEFLAWAGTPLGPLELSGDFSAGFTLSALSFDVDRLTAAAGSDYNLASDDDFVAAGDMLMIDATALGADDGMMFDGAAETDGSFVFLGGESNDFFFGGAGNDRITGAGGADILRGGGGSDIFIYGDAGESSGADYDTIAGFDPAADRIDLPGAISGFGAAIEGGALSTASFDDDLAAVLGGLAPSQAVWFAPDQGDLAGQIFLIVDGNGQAGYQVGEDFVIAVEGAPLADLTGHTDIFI